MASRLIPAARLGLTLTLMAVLALPVAHAEEPEADWLVSYQEGLRLIQDGKPADAIGHFQRAIEINPDAAGPFAAIRLASGWRGRDVREVTLEVALIRRVRDHLRRDELFPAEMILKDIVANRFANPEAHFLLQDVHLRGRRLEAGRHAGKIFKGLLDALLATGDGKSFETAFLVQGINEEYFLIDQALDCRPRARRVDFPPSGGVYDVFSVQCPDGERTLYFNVTAWGPEPAWRLKTYRPESLKLP
jgi:tetratricopeptide (TPR) repeat protein